MKKLAFVVFIFVALVCANSIAIEHQQGMNWCWAACIQDVLAQAGVATTQAEIAARLDGWPRDRPAHTQELVRLLQSYRFRAWQPGRPGSPQELYNTLSEGWKIIAFVRPMNGPVGHFIVLQGINPMNGFVIVSDPATGMTGTYNVQQLYSSWRWLDSVVVGAPTN